MKFLECALFMKIFKGFGGLERDKRTGLQNKDAAGAKKRRFCHGGILGVVRLRHQR